MQIRRIKYKRDGAQTRTLNDTSIDAKHWRYDSADLRAVRSIIKKWNKPVVEKIRQYVIIKLSASL